MVIVALFFLNFNSYHHRDSEVRHDQLNHSSSHLYFIVYKNLKYSLFSCQVNFESLILHYDSIQFNYINKDLLKCADYTWLAIRRDKPQEVDLLFPLNG